MRKRILSIILSISFFITSISQNVCANQTVPSISVSNNQSEYSSVLDASSVTSINTKTVNDVLAQSKFKARQGHGFAAERGNTLIDKIKGKNTVVTGDSNVKNGADRIIRNPDNTVTYIQDKYYADAKTGINACFDETGNFIYLDGNGNPMQIEVPSDQYDEAVKCMREKITEGRIPDVSDPNEAENLVRKGALSYKQAKNLAKAGTVESLTYDAANGVVQSSLAFGISSVLNYAVCRLNGMDEDEALKIALDEGVKTGVLAFGSAVIAGQLSKTGVVNLFKPTSEALVKAFGDDFARALIKSTGENVVSDTATTTALTQNAAKVLRTHALVAVVTLVLFAVPDAIGLFNNRISKKQFAKNFTVTAASIIAGTVGAIAGGAAGSSVAPGVGTGVGAVAGSLALGVGAGVVADKIADKITTDDADEMYEIFEASYVKYCEEYMVNEQEAENVAKAFGDMLNEEMYKDIYKDMYQSEDREAFVDRILVPLFEDEVKKREKIKMPTEKEMREQLKINLTGVVFIH